jgi:hypothetical protein
MPWTGVPTPGTPLPFVFASTYGILISGIFKGETRKISMTLRDSGSQIYSQWNSGLPRMIILMISNVRTHPVHYYTIHGFAGKS